VVITLLRSAADWSRYGLTASATTTFDVTNLATGRKAMFRGKVIN